MVSMGTEDLTLEASLHVQQQQQQQQQHAADII